MVPKTALEELRDLLPTMLEQSQAAGAFAIGVEPHECGSVMNKFMDAHKTKMQTLYGMVSRICNGTPCDMDPEDLKTRITSLMQQYEKRVPLATNLQNEVMGVQKKKRGSGKKRKATTQDDDEQHSEG